MVDKSIRLDFDGCKRELLKRLGENAPGRIQLLTGPRQVGKTTLLLEIREDLGDRVVYAAADGPEASVVGFWERLWTRAVEVAGAREGAVLLVDEIHHVEDWSARLKGEWDRIRREGVRLHVVATGSSALRIGQGSKESLAGRFERLILPHWPASALASSFSLSRDEAAMQVVRSGSYPGAVELLGDEIRWFAYLHDAIVEPAIGRDILSLGSVRKPALLRQVFSVAASSPAQIVSLQKLQGQLRDRGALETIAHYLGLLGEAQLVEALEKYSPKPARMRASPPKLVTLSNALCAVSDPRGIPDERQDPARFGAWVENACLAFALNSGQDVSYWRESPLEVDAVIDGSWGRFAVEVKTGPFDAGDLRGLFEFTKRHPKFSPLIVCAEKHIAGAERLGVQATSWKSFLNEGPPA